MLKEFQKFIMRGNVLDLAVGVIIGSAFTGLVTSLTKNLINPILSMFAGKADLSGLISRYWAPSLHMGILSMTCSTS